MANKKYVSLSKLQTFLDNLKDTFALLSHKHTVSDITDYKAITVDSILSSTSTNPVQNKVIDAEFDAISTAMGALDLAIDGKSDSGHTHDDRYYTESEIDTKVSNINTSITNIVNGTTKVAKATSADSATSANTANTANSATKATQDGNGKVISSTYETKNDANAKLTEAKTYTDTVAEGKANTSHTHTIANITNLQSSLDAKQATITGGATTITSSNLTANRALISDGSGKVAVSAVTSTELGYLDGVTSAIQTQLDSKAASSSLSSYYTKTEIDNMEFITVSDIDTICGSTT